MNNTWADESIDSISTFHSAEPEDVEDLNELLECLGIPLLIQSPTDLTPSLLIAILECILQQRLDNSVRNAATPSEKVIAMKVFLGVLSDDLLNGVDAEISDIDPRRLARGSWEEVVRVGRVLVQVGQRLQAGSYFNDELTNSGAFAETRHKHSSGSEVTQKESPFEGSELELDDVCDGISDMLLEQDISTPSGHTLPAPTSPYSAPQISSIMSMTDVPLDASCRKANSRTDPEPSTWPSSSTLTPLVQPRHGAYFHSPKSTEYAYHQREHPSRSLSDDSHGQLPVRPCRMALPDSVLKAATAPGSSEHRRNRHSETIDGYYIGNDGIPSVPATHRPHKSSSSVMEAAFVAKYESRSSSPVKNLLHGHQLSSRPIIVDDIFSPPVLSSSTKTPAISESSKSDSTGISIRYSGWIDRVEGDIEAFEANRARLKEQERSSESTDIRTDAQASTLKSSIVHTKRDSPRLRETVAKNQGEEIARNSPSVRDVASSTATLRRSSPLSRLSPRVASSGTINPHATRHTSPTQHALALLHERAKMLEELAKLETLRAR